MSRKVRVGPGSLKGDHSIVCNGVETDQVVLMFENLMENKHITITNETNVPLVIVDGVDFREYSVLVSHLYNNSDATRQIISNLKNKNLITTGVIDIQFIDIQYKNGISIDKTITFNPIFDCVLYIGFVRTSNSVDQEHLIDPNKIVAAPTKVIKFNKKTSFDFTEFLDNSCFNYADNTYLKKLSTQIQQYIKPMLSSVIKMNDDGKWTVYKTNSFIVLSWDKTQISEICNKIDKDAKHIEAKCEISRHTYPTTMNSEFEKIPIATPENTILYITKLKECVYTIFSTKDDESFKKEFKQAKDAYPAIKLFYKKVVEDSDIIKDLIIHMVSTINPEISCVVNDNSLHVHPELLTAIIDRSIFLVQNKLV